MAKPEPVSKMTVCSLCGLDWEKHDAKPTAEKCVELLRAELARRPVWSNNISGTTGQPPYFFGNIAASAN